MAANRVDRSHFLGAQSLCASRVQGSGGLWRQRLRNEPVSPAELKRVQQTLLTGAVFGREGVHELADSIARGVTTNDLDYLKTYLKRVSEVTVADVQAAARKYLDPQQRVVVWSVPKESTGGGAEGKSGPAKHRAGRAAAAGAASGFTLTDTRRVVLPNGLTLLLLDGHRQFARDRDLQLLSHLGLVVAQEIVALMVTGEALKRLGARFADSHPRTPQA